MIIEFFKNRWKHYLTGVLFLVLIDYLQILVPKYIGNVVNLVIKPPVDLDIILKYVILIILIAGGVVIGRFIWRMLIVGSARKFQAYAQQKLFDKFLRSPISFFDSTSVGNLMAYYTNDVQAVSQMLSQGIIMTVDAIAMTAFVFGGMLMVVDLRLVLISLIPLPFVALSSWYFGGKIHQRFKMVQSDFSFISERAQESFSNIKTIKSYGVEKEFNGLFKETCDKFAKDNFILLRISAVYGPLISFLAALTMAIAIFLGGQMVISGSVNLGDFVAFISYLGMLTWPFVAIGQVINVVQMGRASQERIDVLMKTPERDDDGVEFPGRFQTLEIKNLDFAYNEKNVIKNLSMKIQAGQKVAIIGKIGSGKSTIAKLMTKLYTVEDGKIFYNGVDINKISAKSLRDNVLLVPQESFLFSTKISQNIAFGLKEFSGDEVEDASKVAHFHEEVVKFEEKYDTLVGERGVTLSGGQRQRLSLSRGVFKDAQVIILDDVLSAVDSQTATMILQDIEKEFKDMTTIVITHNIASIKNSDIIFVMDEGRIVESGNHDELMKLNGLYHRLFMIQQIEREIGK
ncbi:ABC transporter ATP-binding protein [Athalassotoga saccharophila]|uniref:ABC transporter ATP-binding protein n=1 Tax=Athalassotoga saccharophila TaxID=1441386 RepID=UPI00137AB248|nr:ABC transporter ATP-binding protein [Athalassotoga saccharophila]BBJ29047.1 putative multidrug resistance ABC transporter ATP-binding/permease protein YheI [Athalassotoga saccharophila]